MTQRFAAFVVLLFGVCACARSIGSGVLPASSAGNGFAVPHAARIKTIFTFNKTDGELPSGSLIALNGVLYGATALGGKDGNGVVFSLTTSGTQKVLHSFNDTDGSGPQGPLLALNGVLYGTTDRGGKPDDGTIFALKTGGKRLWSYDFKGGWDGVNPSGGLTNLNGTLYGTTLGGGNYYIGSGTFFKVTLSGKEAVLLTFTGGPNGGNPNGSLVAQHNQFYGTTQDGGVSNGSDGTVFRLTKTGGGKILYRFASSGDGDTPKAGLVYLDGTFYGTTEDGGKYYAGTVFSVTPAGTERVMHNFDPKKEDGGYPTAPLIAYNGKLYGTTLGGGQNNLGTIFEITLSGKERVLYSFTGGSDGSDPATGLVELNGLLYGTTGTQYSHPSNGTVFSLKP